MKSALRLAWRALAVAALLLLLYQTWIFAHVVWWIRFDPVSSRFMEDRLEVLQESRPDAGLRHRWVPYERISIHLKRAVLAAEDNKFLDHSGFDWGALRQA